MRTNKNDEDLSSFYSIFIKIFIVIIICTAGVAIYSWQSSKNLVSRRSVGDKIFDLVVLDSLSESKDFDDNIQNNTSEKVNDSNINDKNSVDENTDEKNNIMFDFENIEKLSKKSSIKEDMILLTKVTLIMKQNDKNVALQELEKIISNIKLNDTTRKYAAVLWSSIIIDKDKLTDKEINKAKEYFSFFTDNKKEFFATALLIQELFYIKIGDHETAKLKADVLLNLSDVPESTKDSAKAFLRVNKL